MDYTLESIEQRLGATVKDLQGYRSHSAHLNTFCHPGRAYYTISLHFTVHGMLRGPSAVKGDTLQKAVEQAFAELGRIVAHCKVRPALPVAGALAKRRPGRPRKQSDNEHDLAA